MNERADETALEELLRYLRDDRGFDYTEYKRPSLTRRIRKRMQDVGIDEYDEYRRWLEDEPDEVDALLNTILVNVTGFFRDDGPWGFLSSEVVPAIVQEKQARGPIRVWSAGCASGEEAYSLSMLFAEALDEIAFRDRVKIYATDIDDDALSHARHAAYSDDHVRGVPAPLRAKYFQPANGRFFVRNDVRRAVVFGRNDLLRDPPISRVDLLVCRNTLMYFSREAQDRIVSNFFFSLTRTGFLFLGKAEALQTRGDLFVPYDLKRRIFRKNLHSDAEQRARVPVAPDAQRVGLGDGALSELAFEHGPLAHVVVDGNGTVTAINQPARSLFGLSLKDVGRPLKDLAFSYRPVELRSIIEQVAEQGRPVVKREIVWTQADGTNRYFDLQVTPLTAGAGPLSGTSVTFIETSRARLVEEELEKTRRDLETAYEELQSTVEELETTNEELQSTNEELETTNEELHSTNEELETINEELRERTDDALHANVFLTSVLESLRQSVIVVDREHRITAWSAAAGDLWGLRADEVHGRDLLNLDIGLPVDALREPIQEVLSGGEPGELRLLARNRRGQLVECTTSITPLRNHSEKIGGAILVTLAEVIPR